VQPGEAPGARTASVVFFDLGGVVVDVDLDRARAAWAQTMNDDPAGLDRHFLDSGIKDRIDLGLLSAADAVEDIATRCGGQIDPDRIVDCWNSTLSTRPAVSELVHEVARRVRCAVISNTDPMHFAFIKAQSGIDDVIERWICSFEAGSLKPDTGILRMALRELNVAAEHALLIDDRRENLLAAQSLGMDGLHCSDFESLRTGLVERGLLDSEWRPATPGS